MTQESAATLLKNFSEPYLSPYRSELPEWDAMRWVKLFMELSIPYKQAGTILTEYLSNNPPRYKEDGSACGVMPDIDQIKSFLLGMGKATTNPDYCPCCAGFGWIFFESLNGVVRCDCSSPEIDMGKYNYSVKTLSDIYPNYGEAKCDSFQCAPRKDSPCPLGSQFYNAKKIEFMDRERQKTGWKLGLTFHKSGYVKGVMDSLNDIEGG